MSLYNNSFFKKHKVVYTPIQIEIAKIIYNEWLPKSIFDVGCGVGGYLEGFHSCGCLVEGCDYSYDEASNYMVEAIKSKAFKFDLSKRLAAVVQFDLVLSVEVAEHLDEKDSVQFCNNIMSLAKNRVFFTAAGPKQRGRGHVNCQPKEYWIERMSLFGGIRNKIEEESIINKLSGVDKLGITKNIMVFNKNETIY